MKLNTIARWIAILAFVASCELTWAQAPGIPIGSGSSGGPASNVNPVTATLSTVGAASGACAATGCLAVQTQGAASAIFNVPSNTNVTFAFEALAPDQATWVAVYGYPFAGGSGVLTVAGTTGAWVVPSGGFSQVRVRATVIGATPSMSVSGSAAWADNLQAAMQALQAPLPTGSSIELTDGVNTVAVSPANTAPTASQPALVVGISPNGPTAAGADNSSNGTINAINVYSANRLFDGSNWNRMRGNSDFGTPPLTLTTQGAGTVNGSDQTNYNWRGGQFGINITLNTSCSVVYNIQGKDTASGTYYTILASAAQASTGFVNMTVYPGAAATSNVSIPQPLPHVFRVQAVLTGGGCSVTSTAGVSMID